MITFRGRESVFCLNVKAGLLLQGDRRIDLPKRQYDLLKYLAERPGELVSWDTLREDVWGGDNVNPDAIARTLYAVRQALGDEHPMIIETKRKGGVRFIGTVTQNSFVAGGIKGDIGSLLVDLTAIGGHPLLEPYLPAARRLVGLVPKPGFHFLIISGCSSAGKDVLVAEALRRVGTGAEMLKKYMTRGRRAGEPEYSVSVTSSQFEKFERTGKIIFPYHKRDCDYGFDADDFVSAAKHGVCKVAIFTELYAVPRIVTALRASGVLATPVFIDVERAYLVRRSYHRNLGPNEVQKRLESVDQDLNVLAVRTIPLEHEYYLVRNNEGEPFNAAKDKVEALVRHAIAGDLPWPAPPNKALHPTGA